MKQKTNNSFSVIIGLIAILAIGYFAYKLIVLIFEKTDKLDANVIVAVLAGTFTVLGYFITRYLERSKLIEQQIREQKLPIYVEFIDFVFKIFEQTKNNQAIDSDELEKFYWNLNRKSILWLSDKSLKSYIDWKNQIIQYSEIENNSSESTTKMLLAFEKLLLDFRKDIGHKNEGISNGDILTIFINDWHKYKDLK